MKHRFYPRRTRKAFFALMLLFFVGALAVTAIHSAVAQPGRTAPIVIRDTEIENDIKEWIKPVVEAAQLDPKAVKIILVQDNSLNAFVAGGPNIFIYTGLLIKTKNPDEVIGVVAHELGHIRGGHLVRVRGAAENASYESILGTLLGIGAAVLTGEGGLGAAVAAGAQSMATQRFLSFTRIQESSADQAALSYMDRAGVDPSGLVDFMKTLENQELLPASQQSQYVRTHPMTRDRIEALTAGYDRSAHKGKALPTKWENQHARMVAKLVGFITPEQVAWNYDTKDRSIPALYARTIADYRQNNVQRALDGIDELIALEPNNPYFFELKGQMLVDFGRIEEALPPYQKAVQGSPDAALIQAAYAHALIESSEKDKSRLDKAITQLKQSLKEEPRSARTYRLLATAYGRKGNDPLARLYLAEEALLKGQIPYAKQQATFARDNLGKGTRDWLRAQDILNALEQGGKSN